MIAVRLLPGLALIACVSGLVVVAASYPGRAGLHRLQGEAVDLAKREAALNERISALVAGEPESVSLPENVIWRSVDSTSVDVVLQTALTSAVDAAGLRLISFGVAPPPASVSLSTIACDIELAGDHESLVRFLAALEALRPALAVSDLWLRQLPPDPDRAGAPISIRLTVWGFREAEGTP